LSKGGRVILIKSTLFNLPTYFLSLFPIPSSVASRIEKLHQDFLWGGIGEEFKYHLVSWSKVCSPIAGGLGIWNLRIFNKALLGKWLWRYAHEREAWWKSIMDAKYGSSRAGWCSLDPPRSHGVGLWKNIRKGWNLFHSHTRLILGIGSRIQFCDDVWCGVVWCGEMPLKGAFLVLYDIARDKDAHVADHLVVVNGSYQWDVSFFRATHDWEVDVLAPFFSLLYSSKVDREGEDQFWWSSSHKGKCDVRYFYKVLACKEAVHFSWKSIWLTKAPLKVVFFAWAAALGKILTLDNLRKKCVIVIDRCCMCKMNGEFMDHLLLHYEVARALWNAIFSRFNLS
jgi:hypothetical protein